MLWWLTDARNSLGAPNPNYTQGPKMPAVTGCQQLQEERLHGALGYEKDAASFTFSWLYFLWLCGNVTFSQHTLDSNRVTADWHEESSAGWMRSDRSDNNGDVSWMDLWIFMTLRVHRLGHGSSSPPVQAPQGAAQALWVNVLTRFTIPIYRLRKRISWLTYLFLTFCIAAVVTAKRYEQKRCSCFTLWCSVLPPPCR